MLGQTSSLSLLGGAVPASGRTAPRPAAPAGFFGPDFLLGAVGARLAGGGAAYDSTGRPLQLPENSPQVRERKAAIEKIQSLFRAGDPAGARAEAEVLLRRNPKDSTAAAYIGHSYLREGDYISAVRYLSRAAESSSSVAVQRDLRAAQFLQRGEASALEEVGRLLRNKQTWKEGLQLATYLLDRNPANVDARIVVADFYEKRGRANLAGAELADGLEDADPGRAAALLPFLEGFARRHGTDPGGFDLLAQAYLRAGRLDDARAAFDEAIRLAGDDFDFISRLKADFADVYAGLGREHRLRGEEHEARRDFEQALALVNNDAHRGNLFDLELDAGRRYVRQGRLRAAQEAYERARVNLPAVDPGERREQLIEAYDALAAKLALDGDLETLVGARYGAYVLDSGDAARKRTLADAHDAYGLEMFAAQDWRGAYRQFKAAADLFPDDTTYLAHRDDARSRF
jgi:tetratricopeptide (TPR) repeat protein